MLVKDLLQILEMGTDIVIYDSKQDEVLIHQAYLSSTIFTEYLDRHICCINTSCDDCDIELVIH